MNTEAIRPVRYGQLHVELTDSTGTLDYVAVPEAVEKTPDYVAFMGMGEGMLAGRGLVRRVQRTTGANGVAVDIRYDTVTPSQMPELVRKGPAVAAAFFGQGNPVDTIGTSRGGGALIIAAGEAVAASRDSYTSDASPFRSVSCSSPVAIVSGELGRTPGARRWTLLWNLLGTSALAHMRHTPNLSLPLSGLGGIKEAFRHTWQGVRWRKPWAGVTEQLVPGVDFALSPELAQEGQRSLRILAEEGIVTVIAPEGDTYHRADLYQKIAAALGVSDVIHVIPEHFHPVVITDDGQRQVIQMVERLRAAWRPDLHDDSTPTQDMEPTVAAEGKSARRVWEALTQPVSTLATLVLAKLTLHELDRRARATAKADMRPRSKRMLRVMDGAVIGSAAIAGALKLLPASRDIAEQYDLLVGSEQFQSGRSLKRS